MLVQDLHELHYGHCQCVFLLFRYFVTRISHGQAHSTLMQDQYLRDIPGYDQRFIIQIDDQGFVVCLLFCMRSVLQTPHNWRLHPFAKPLLLSFLHLLENPYKLFIFIPTLAKMTTFYYWCFCIWSAFSLLGQEALLIKGDQRIFQWLLLTEVVWASLFADTSIDLTAVNGERRELFRLCVDIVLRQERKNIMLWKE